jgi:uncharacterized membrane protein
MLLIVFVVFFPLGWGSITYILVSELVPTMVRTETAVLCNSWEQLLQVSIAYYVLDHLTTVKQNMLLRLSSILDLTLLLFFCL